MGVERLREIAEKLREMAQYAREDYVYARVEVEDDEYEFDLGTFGTQYASVSIEKDEYSLDAREILDSFPISTSGFESLGDELETLASEFEEPEEQEAVDLDTVLAQMEEKGGEEGRLARALRSVAEVFRESVVNALNSIPDLSGLSIGALPPKPLPWPGALRAEIDYTAFDFPRRYQPPPGFDWVKKNKTYEATSYETAEQYDVAFLKENTTGYMILNNKGEISWMKRGGDDLGSGGRWAIWFLPRDGIPTGNGNYDGSTEPLGLDVEGNRISGVISPWRSGSDETVARQRLAEIRARAEFDQSKPDFGVNYDPLTVEVAQTSYTCNTDELRLGDLVTGDFGRVIEVSRMGSGMFVLKVQNEEGRIREEVRTNQSWSYRPIMGVDRLEQPTAFSLSEGRPAGVNYDPLTVQLEDNESGVRTSELRLGEDITGEEFGRVVGVTIKPNGTYEIKMNRDGAINTDVREIDIEWSVLRLAEGRDDVPAALSASTSIDYDPLTVSVKTNSAMLKASELRLGDDIIGNPFGRVIAIEDGMIVMNRDGTINKTAYSPTFGWAVLLIDVQDRETVPTAASIGAAAREPVAF